ncbi:MAG TPA: S8/S53 family peptidase, partial [Ilumatobacter sp.]|nr:S8/S53 family peptidase [Ilumatobacter sp.]
MPFEIHDDEHELWPYRSELLISTKSLQDLIGRGVLEDRIVEIETFEQLGGRGGEGFTEVDFNLLTGRVDLSGQSSEQTRWLYDIGDPELDPFDDALKAFDNGVETSPILLTTLSGHYSVMPATTPVEDSSRTPDPDLSNPSTVAHIAVVDSGYRESPAPTWLAERARAVDATIDDDEQGPASWRGHGKFVASIIVQQNPNTFVWVAALKPVAQDKFLHWIEVDPEDTADYYLADEFGLFSAVRRLLDVLDSDISNRPQNYSALNLSVGAWTCGLSISGLLIRAALDLWRSRQENAPIVAAAGNHFHTPPPEERFIPGQFQNVPGLYGVKSLTQDEQQTSFFSNEALVGATGEGLLGVLDDGTTPNWRAAHWSGS